LVTRISGFGLAVILAIVAAVVEPGPCRAQSERFTASPTSGRAPLTVTFCASAGIVINFGDGTSGSMGIAQSGECPAGSLSVARHTYAAAGAYQLSGLPCPSSTHGASCGEVARQAGTVTINVTP
jgi:hypothetical protein